MSNSPDRKEDIDEGLWKIVYSRDQSIIELRRLNIDLQTQLARSAYQLNELLENLHQSQQELHQSQQEFHQSQQELHQSQQELQKSLTSLEAMESNHFWKLYSYCLKLKHTFFDA